MNNDSLSTYNKEKILTKRHWPRILAGLIILLAGWLALLGVRIVAAGGEESPRAADVAVVLGAAVQGAGLRPSSRSASVTA
jgi:uncharacterized RDD family membrane protein YckC